MDQTDNQLTNLIYKKEIKVFQHCNYEKIICFNLPEKCPVCNTSLKTVHKVPPFILDSPFIKSRKLPERSLILQPSCGDYFNYFSLKNGNIGNLHIGLTNSLSECFDFDFDGLKRNSKKWLSNPAIFIKLDQTNMKMTRFINLKAIFNENKKWDDLLESFWTQRQKYWNSCSYNEFEKNCLDFVLNFLLLYGYFDIQHEENSIVSTEPVFLSKNDFLMKSFLRKKLVDKLIEPAVRKSFKYTLILLKLKNRSYFKENI
jgi:hypothetical protein